MIPLRGLFSLFALVITMSLGGCAGQSGGGLWQDSSAPQDQSGMVLSSPAATMPVPQTGGAPVKVGLILPLSGPQGAIGKSLEQAAQLALFDMGTDQFELIPRDTGTTPQQAAVAAQDVINQGASVILGPLMADSVRAAKTVTAASGVPMIAFSTDWTLAGNNTYIMGFLPFLQVSRIVDYAAQRGVKTIAYVAPRDTYGDTAVRIFEQEATRHGMTIAGRVRFSGPSDPTLPGQLQALAQNKTLQGVFIPAGAAQADMISSSLSGSGLTPDRVLRLGTGLWDDPSLVARPSMQGAVFAGPSPRQYAVFEAKYRSVYGQVPPRIASLAYDATALAAVLARQGGPQGFTPAAIMNPNGFSGMDGIFRFNNNALAERGLAILQIDNRQIREVASAPASFQ